MYSICMCVAHPHGRGSQRKLYKYCFFFIYCKYLYYYNYILYPTHFPQGNYKFIYNPIDAGAIFVLQKFRLQRLTATRKERQHTVISPSFVESIGILNTCKYCLFILICRTFYHCLLPMSAVFQLFNCFLSKLHGHTSICRTIFDIEVCYCVRSLCSFDKITTFKAQHPPRRVSHHPVFLMSSNQKSVIGLQH